MHGLALRMHLSENNWTPFSSVVQFLDMLAQFRPTRLHAFCIGVIGLATGRLVVRSSLYLRTHSMTSMLIGRMVGGFYVRSISTAGGSVDCASNDTQQVSLVNDTDSDDGDGDDDGDVENLNNNSDGDDDSGNESGGIDKVPKTEVRDEPSETVSQQSLQLKQESSSFIKLLKHSHIQKDTITSLLMKSPYLASTHNKLGKLPLHYLCSNKPEDINASVCKITKKLLCCICLFVYSYDVLIFYTI